MSFDPLLAAPWHIQIHAFAAMAAALLGVIQLLAPKGTLPHKAMGMVWVLLMGTVAISSAFIVHKRAPDEPFLAHYSWIHLLTLLTLFSLGHGVMLILRGGAKMKRHAMPFISIFIGGLLIAGAFAFTPGRVMHAVVFGGEVRSLNNLEDPSWYFVRPPEDSEDPAP